MKPGIVYELCNCCVLSAFPSLVDRLTDAVTSGSASSRSSTPATPQMARIQQLDCKQSSPTSILAQPDTVVTVPRNNTDEVCSVQLLTFKWYCHLAAFYVMVHSWPLKWMNFTPATITYLPTTVQACVSVACNAVSWAFASDSFQLGVSCTSCLNNLALPNPVI